MRSKLAVLALLLLVAPSFAARAQGPASADRGSRGIAVYSPGAERGGANCWLFDVSPKTQRICVQQWMTARPVPGVEVRGPLGSRITGDDGCAPLELGDAKHAIVELRHPDYRPACVDVTRRGDEALSPDQPPLVPMRFLHLGVIRGRVLDAEGNPLPGVWVDALPGKKTVSILLGISKADGSYAIENVPPGIYRLRAIGPAYKQWERKDVQMSAGSEVHLDVRF